MANELKITDVVDQKAFNQLREFKAELNENYSIYKKLALELAGGVKINPKTFQELSDKSTLYNKTLNDLIVTQNRMAAIQEKYNKTLEDYGNKINKLLTLNTLPKQFDDLVKGINKISGSLDTLSSKFQNTSSAQSSASQANQSYTQSTNQLNQAIATTEIRYAEIVDNILAYDSNVTKLTADTIQNKIRIKELGDELKRLDKEYKNGSISLTDYLNKSALLKQRQTELSEQNKQYSNLMRNHAAVIISASSSYNEMNAAVLALEKRLKSMPKDSFLGSEGQKTLQQIQTLKNELKSMDAQMGNYQRNVGNYASHWNGLGMSVQQVARELPSLAVGWNTFFLAISNNLPILADEIKKARIEYQAMQEAGQKGIPVWRQIAKSIFSWQTALVVGITLLSVYGKDIMDWIGSLFKGKRAVDDIVSAERMWVNALKEGRSASIKERTELDLLYKATQDASRSMQERNAAVDELQKKFPGYFENISKEDFLAGKAADAYARLTEQILKTAQARAIQDKLVERSKEQLEYEDQLNNLFYERSVLNDKMRDAERRLAKGPAAATNAARDIYDLGKEAADLDEKISEMQNKLRENERQTIKLENKLNVDDLLNPLGKTGDKSKKSADELAKYQEDIAKRLSETRISLIDDEYEKERQTAQKKYEENIASIKGNSEEENELRRNYEQILQDELLAIDKNYLDKKDEEERKRIESLAKYEMDDKKNKYADESIKSSRNMQRDIREQAALYEQGIINKKEYEKRKAQITQDYAIIETKRTMALLQELINVQGISDEERLRLKEALAEEEIKLIEKVRDAHTKARDEENESDKKYWADIQSSIDNLKNVSDDAVDGLGTLFGGITELILKMVKDGKLGLEDLLASAAAISEGLSTMVIGMYDRQIEKIEEQQEKNEEAGEEEKERIEDLVNSGVISTEEGEARKRAAEQRTADKNKELEKQKAEIQQKQAKWDKANSIIQATIATSLAVTKALPNFVVAAIVAAMGAAQIAMIAAQPIPKYAKGTKDKSHPGGLAIVGDGGKREVILTDSGAYITPSVPTLVDMPKHAEVIPDVVDYKKMALRSDAMMLDKMRRDKGEPVIVNVNNDYKNLERKMDVTNQGMSNLNKTLRKMARSAEYRYLDSRL
nr:MAG TPA: tail tape measure protein [Caudoviricetes sp.]